jgi:membrane protein
MSNTIMIYCRRIYRFWSWVLRQFLADRCMVRASALTYASLLALVPFMIVIVSALSLFPFFDQASHNVQSFIFQNFVPHTGDQVLQVVSQLESQASKLPAIGFAFLFVTAIMLLFNLDRTLNEIIQTQSKRRLLGSFLMYWALMTIGPLLLGASLAVTSYIQSIKWLDFMGVSSLIATALSPLPFLLSAVAFSFIYIVVPHGGVKFRYGIIGGVFAAILFELAKHVFAFYVETFPSYKLLYGALATIPLFLLWVYVSWMIFLLGAEVVNGLRHQQAYRSVQVMEPLLLAYVALYEGWRQYQNQSAITLAQILSAIPFCSIEQLDKVLQQLCELGYFMLINKEEYVLCKDLRNITFSQLQYDMGFTVTWQVVTQAAKKLTAFAPLAKPYQAQVQAEMKTSPKLVALFEAVENITDTTP